MTPWTTALRAPLPMGFPRQECWSVLPFPSPGYLPHIGTEPGSPIFIDHAKAFDYMDHNKLWKILKEMGIPDHLICLLRNLYAGQEAAIRTGCGTTDWFQIEKGIYQGCILSPSLFNFYAEYIM